MTTALVPHLTPIQRRVLTEAAAGGCLRDIAERLGMPRDQVAARLAEGYKNLHLGHLPRDEKREQAIRLARRCGFIS